VPRRGPKAGVLRTKLDFHCSGVNSRSCPLLQSQKIHKYTLMVTILHRFSRKIMSSHECRESHDHLCYFVPVWRADSVDHKVAVVWLGERTQGEHRSYTLKGQISRR